MTSEEGHVLCTGPADVVEVQSVLNTAKRLLEVKHSAEAARSKKRKAVDSTRVLIIHANDAMCMYRVIRCSSSRMMHWSHVLIKEGYAREVEIITDVRQRRNMWHMVKKLYPKFDYKNNDCWLQLGGTEEELMNAVAIVEGCDVRERPTDIGGIEWD